MHFQAPPHSQIKMVRCRHGLLYDVVVDVRVGSPTYGQWSGSDLSFENGRQMLVPHGCLHGFMTLVLNTEMIYKCSDYYAPDHDGGVRFDDPEIGIDWPLGAILPILSDKDREAPLLMDFKSPFTFEDSQA
jgi:dTDP-4-dehydrorhamnose 3,5-epimerase